MNLKTNLFFNGITIIEKNGYTYHRISFKDKNGDSLDTLLIDPEPFKDLVLDKEYTFNFTMYKSKKDYSLKLFLEGVE